MQFCVARQQWNGMTVDCSSTKGIHCKISKRKWGRFDLISKHLSFREGVLCYRWVPHLWTQLKGKRWTRIGWHQFENSEFVLFWSHKGSSYLYNLNIYNIDNIFIVRGYLLLCAIIFLYSYLLLSTVTFLNRSKMLLKCIGGPLLDWCHFIYFPLNRDLSWTLLAG